MGFGRVGGGGRVVEGQEDGMVWKRYIYRYMGGVLDRSSRKGGGFYGYAIFLSINEQQD